MNKTWRTTRTNLSYFLAFVLFLQPLLYWRISSSRNEPQFRKISVNRHRKFLGRDRYSVAKYLLYSPQMGLTNQVIALCHAALWAEKLKRILVVPHLIWPRASDILRPHHSLVPYDDVFDLTLFRTTWPDVPLVSIRDVDESVLQGIDKVYGLERNPNADILEHHYFERVIGKKSLQYESIRQTIVQGDTVGVNSSDAVARMGHMLDEDVLAFDGFFFTPFLDKIENVSRLWTVLSEPIDSLSKLASGFVSEQQTSASSGDQPLVCMHVRRGDFSEYCASQKVAWVDELTSQNYSCFVDDTRIKSTLDKYIDRPSKILLLSDSAASADELKHQYDSADKIVTSSDVHSYVLSNFEGDPSALDVVSAVIEQNICARYSKTIILNRFSTFSRGVFARLSPDHPEVLWW